MGPLIANALLLLGGIAVLYFGAEWMVRGSARLAVSLGLRPIVVGLTVVSIGTSAPELVVSLVAALSGDPDMAMGNVMGSNLANIGLILGLSALLRPLKVTQQVVRRDLPLMLAVTVLLYPLMGDNELARGDGFILLAALCLYLFYVLRAGRRGDALPEYQDLEKAAVIGAPEKARMRDVALVLIGCMGLALGGVAIVESATYVATALGVSQLTVGVTVVAVGTSLPELATSVVASIREESDIAVGNVIGSNVFNVAAILGITATVTPMSIHESVIEAEFPAVLLLSLVVWPLSRTGLLIRRWEGGLLLGLYLVLGFLLVRSGPL